MNPDDPMAGIAANEPALSPNFAARVIDRVRVQRKRRRNRRRAAIAAAVAITGGLALLSIRGGQLAKSSLQDQGAAAAVWSESSAEQAGWPLGWDTGPEQTVGGYFFPDAGSIETFSADDQSDAPPSLGSVLGFDQGAIQRTDVTESNGWN